MLLLTSILSAAVVGAIGYQSGRSSLRASVFDRLTEIRQSQSRQLQTGIADLKNSLVVYSRGSTATQAIEAFTAGFDQLATATINPAQQQALVDYYTKRFAKDEDGQTGDDVDVDALLPTSPAQRLPAVATTPPRSATTTSPPRTGTPRSSSTTPATAARGRRPTPGTTTSSARSSPASNSRTPCCSTPAATSSTAPTRASTSAPTSSPGRTRAASSATPIQEALRLQRGRLRRGSPTSATISPPTSRPPGSSPRSGRRAASKACWRCSSRSPRSTS